MHGDISEINLWFIFISISFYRISQKAFLKNNLHVDKTVGLSENTLNEVVALAVKKWGG